MTDEEREEKYVEIANYLISLKQRQLYNLDWGASIGNGVVIGSVLASITGLIADPNIDLFVPILVGGIALVFDVLCRLAKNAVIKNAYQTAIKLVDEVYDQDEYENYMPFSLAMPLEPGNNDEELTLAGKCNLLINYAEEVGYPGYEDDIDYIYRIKEKIYNGEDVMAVISDMESSMLAKAYKFYTGDFVR